MPEYYKYWTESCVRNQNCADFLVITDQKVRQDYPNIRILNTTMDALKQRIGDHFGMKISFEKAFKACDFRPAYGEIFANELQGYAYWGHCDLDQVWGDLRLLLDREDLDTYDKIGRSGHLTLFRNDPAVNGLYRQDGALYDWKTVFSSSSNYAFDERTGICRIAQKQGTPYLNIVKLRADIRVRTRRLEINGEKNYDKQLFYWENGHLYRAYQTDGQIHQEPFVYIHFQKKKLRSFCEGMPNAFFIGREGFYPKTGPVTAADFDRYNSADGKIPQIFDTVKYYSNKLKDYFGSNQDQKQVWMAQKKIGNENYD